MYNLNGIDSKFRLAILVARRAKQLIGGAKRKIEFKADNPLTTAMEEFRQGKIDWNVLNEQPTLLFEDPQVPESAETAAADGELDSEAELADGVELEEEMEAEPQPEA